MVGHHDCGKQNYAPFVLSETVLQDEVACFLGEDERSACAESYEKRCVSLEMGEAAAILIFAGSRGIGRHWNISTIFSFFVSDE
jgi:hypothetical protein